MTDLTAPVDRVLIVDDDPDINRLVRALLRTQQIEASSAFSGEEALDRLAVEASDLVLLDISLPAQSGLEVLAEIRARGLDTSVVMMTAMGSEQAAAEALRLGADDYLPKPFSTDDFRAMLRRNLQRIRLTRENARLRAELDQRREQLEADLATAASVQQSLLPGEIPHLPGLEVAAVCLPARDVAGDFFDWQVTGPARLTVTVADVMGKGLPAALFMATIRAALRVAGRDLSPAGRVGVVANGLYDDLNRAGVFVTLFHVDVDAAAGRLDYVDAGHGHAILRRADGTREKLTVRDLPLGILPDQEFHLGSVGLGPGDLLAIFSDGLSEVEDEAGRELGHEGVMELLREAGPAEVVVRRLAAAAQARVGDGHLGDDLTLVVLRATGAGTGS